MKRTFLHLALALGASLMLFLWRGPAEARPTEVEHHITLDSTQLGVSTVASGLDVPWEIAWGPDNWLWITEQGGTVSRIQPATGQKKVLLVIPDVWRKRTTGLLGMALHPDMKRYPYVVVNYTFQRDSAAFSRLVRYTYQKDSLVGPLVLLEIPANTGHNGSRVSIAPDGKVYWATGDAVKDANAQDVQSLNGKILRLNIDGSVPADNPMAGNPVWAWGFRNMQGLVWAGNGQCYTSEHGDANDDEINLIHVKGNYGWPQVQGFAEGEEERSFSKTHSTLDPLKGWTPTIAPAGIDYYNHNAIPEWQNSLLLTTLKAQSFRVLKLNQAGTAIEAEAVHLDKTYGRLRDLCVSPQGDIYVSTSNRDWNPAPGFPRPQDDRILRIYRTGKIAASKVPSSKPDNPAPARSTPVAKAKLTYTQYCASCHKEDGKGVAGTFPPLKGASKVMGNKKDLINLVLHGSVATDGGKKKVYDQPMPAFGFLEDEAVAAVLTYVRSSWGNRAGAVTPAEVTQVRKSKNSANQ